MKAFVFDYILILVYLIAWELSHTLIWEINFYGGSSSAWTGYGFAMVYILIGLNIASLSITKANQAVYDFIAGTYITVQPEQ